MINPLQNQYSVKSASAYAAAGANAGRVSAYPVNTAQHLSSLKTAPANSQPATHTNTVGSPLGLQIFNYGSTAPAQAQLLHHTEEGKDYIAAYVPTPIDAKNLYDAHVANVFNPAWQEQIAMAVERNGGLGSEEDGFLAFAKDGFVRLKNENLSAEQNRILAAISLQTGTHIEDLPARSAESTANSKIGEWVDSFIRRYQTAMEQFLANPAVGFHVKDGRRNYVMQADPNSGVVGSMYYKEHGGVRGFVQKNLEKIGQVADGISLLGSALPGWGTVAAGIAQAVKFGSNIIATGKAKIQDLIGLGVSAFKGLGAVSSAPASTVATAASGAGTGIFGGIGSAIADAVSGVGDWFKSLLPDANSIWGQTLNKGLAIASDAFEKGKFSDAHWSASLGVVKELLFGNEQVAGILSGPKELKLPAGVWT